MASMRGIHWGVLLAQVLDLREALLMEEHIFSNLEVLMYVLLVVYKMVSLL